MDRFDTMLAFTRVVELSSFTKASTSLNLPKATISAQVLALEKRLRVKLLHRTTRHVSVTADGAAYYERAIRLLNELDETEASIANASTTPKGRLRVDVPGSIGRRILIPALKSFFVRYPEIELEVGCTDRPVDLLHEGIDCVIRGGEILDESLVARRLGDIRLLTCASPAYLREYGMPATVVDLERHVLVHMFSARTGKNFAFDFLENGVKTPVYGDHSVTFNDLEACAAAAIAGLGIVQLPLFMANDEIAQGKLTAVLPDIEIETVPLHILYLQNRHLSSKVRAFVEWVAELIATGPYVIPLAPPRRSGPR
ncbi:MAG: transcriptional regulator, LysR family [Herbaspirillum sp.]|jgi:LysR family transcriptional regulator for bpeEF and oprC|nr:transcriptional regulator, LysR family [Herbaspirillum sp.]